MSKPPPETTHVNCQHPVRLKAAMQRLAEENCRTLNAEYAIAAKQHVKSSARKS